MFLRIHFFLLLVFLFSRLIVNYLFWWSCFLLLRMVFVYISKLWGLDTLSIRLFFLFQEIVGILFLFNFREVFQGFVVLLKVGVSPFHFWLYYLCYFVEGYLLIWLFVLYKASLLPMVLYFYCDWFLLLLFGLCLIYIQIRGVLLYKFIFFFSSLESFGWLLIGIGTSLINYVGFFFFYFFLVVVMFSSFNKFMFFNLEQVYFFFGMPLMLGFFMKFYFLGYFLSYTLFVMLYLFLLFFLYRLVLLKFFLFYTVNSYSYFGGSGGLGMFFVFIFSYIFMCFLIY